MAETLNRYVTFQRDKQLNETVFCSVLFVSVYNDNSVSNFKKSLMKLENRGDAVLIRMRET